MFYRYVINLLECFKNVCVNTVKKETVEIAYPINKFKESLRYCVQFVR